MVSGSAENCDLYDSGALFYTVERVLLKTRGGFEWYVWNENKEWGYL